MAELFLQLLEIDDPALLMTLDADQFLTAHNVLVQYFHPNKNCAWSPVGPVVDGNFVPTMPISYLSEEPYPRDDFELMIGFAKDEWQAFHDGGITDPRALQKRLATNTRRAVNTRRRAFATDKEV